MQRVASWLTTPGAWAVRGYRVASWLWRRRLRFVALLVSTAAQVLSGAEVHPAADIGRGFAMPHPGGIVIGSCARLGTGCIVSQGATIGGRGEAGPGMPRLGDRVLVGANACVLGPITVGDGAKIGAGAVVLRDVPAGWTAVGNPARLLPPKGEREASRAAEGGLRGPDVEGHGRGPNVGRR